jgi:hypothetical protein
MSIIKSWFAAFVSLEDDERGTLLMDTLVEMFIAAIAITAMFGFIHLRQAGSLGPQARYIVNTVAAAHLMASHEPNNVQSVIVTPLGDGRETVMACPGAPGSAMYSLPTPTTVPPPPLPSLFLTCKSAIFPNTISLTGVAATSEITFVARGNTVVAGATSSFTAAAPVCPAVNLVLKISNMLYTVDCPSGLITAQTAPPKGTARSVQ